MPHSVRRTGAAVIGRIPMRIRRGPNEGMRWSIASAGRGALSGTFERERVAAITSMIRPGDCVWDIGAHKGYITLAAARRAGPTGRVYAIEPGPPNLEYLRRHIEWNDVSNVEIVPVAVSGEDGTSIFGGPGSSTTHRLGRGDYTVEVRSVASLLEEGPSRYRGARGQAGWITGMTRACTTKHSLAGGCAKRQPIPEIG